jgi:hypothetical protein
MIKVPLVPPLADEESACREQDSPKRGSEVATSRIERASLLRKVAFENDHSEPTVAFKKPKEENSLRQ